MINGAAKPYIKTGGPTVLHLGTCQSCRALSMMTKDPGSLKRKRPSNPHENSRKKKAFTAQDARVILTQTSGKAFGNGGLDADKFIRAREFEIKALEEGIKRSKQTLNTRAFQQVPRDLRRRTASHNVKRVPKRLQARAAKEVHTHPAFESPHGAC